jgi:hypothetical protein
MEGMPPVSRSLSKRKDPIAQLQKDFPDLDVDSIPIKKLHALVMENEIRREGRRR